jgi:tetratricopeptide (TPR) repeat protein
MTMADHKDIFTADALAWAYLQTGRVADAKDAMTQALRTGTKDRVILYHAAEIERQLGNRHAARQLAAAALDGSPHFDLVAAPGAARLRATLLTQQVAQR